MWVSWRRETLELSIISSHRRDKMQRDPRNANRWIQLLKRRIAGGTEVKMANELLVKRYMQSLFKEIPCSKSLQPNGTSPMQPKNKKSNPKTNKALCCCVECNPQLGSCVVIQKVRRRVGNCLDCQILGTLRYLLSSEGKIKATVKLTPSNKQKYEKRYPIQYLHPLSILFTL